MLVSDGLSVCAIAGELNRRGIEYVGNSKWDYQAVYGILSHPKYAGWHVFGRTSSKLSTPTIRLPKTAWILKSGAFEPIVDHATFAKAEGILQGRTIRQSNDEILGSLRELLAREGRLSLSLIKKSADTPSPSTYRHRFGSLRRAYELIGYGKAFGPIDQRRRTQAMRDELIARIVTIFPRDVSVVRPGGRWRSRLRMRNGTIVSVLVARSVRTWKAAIRWRVDPVPQERRYVTLLVRLNADSDSFLDFHFFPRMDRRKRFDIELDDKWLNRGISLNDLSSFCVGLANVRGKKSRYSAGEPTI